MGVGGVRHQAERGDDGERHQRSGCALVSYNLSLIASRKSRWINVKRSKRFLFQPNGCADRASSSALCHIHCDPTAHGRQSMGGLGQQQDPPMTKLRRQCGTVYQGLASVCGSVAIHGVTAGPIRIFPVQIVELARRIGRHKSSDSRRPAKRILEQGNARSGWVRRSQRIRHAAPIGMATRRQLQGRGDGGRRRRLDLTRMRVAFNETWDF
jgi:hypothetical protein